MEHGYTDQTPAPVRTGTGGRPFRRGFTQIHCCISRSIRICGNMYSLVPVRAIRGNYIISVLFSFETQRHKDAEAQAS